MTVGIIGAGRIGQTVAAHLSGFGCKVLYWNRTPRDTIAAEYRPLDDLLKECDIISLHLTANDETYHFMDAESFRKWIAMDQFLEYAEYVGNFYGTPKRFVDEAMDKGQDVILDIEVQGALQVTSKRPDTVKIFIAPPSWKELERRLKDRGTDDPEKVQKRLLRAKVEFQTAHTYDYFVINDTVEDAVRELDAIITAEHCKPKERMSVLAE